MVERAVWDNKIVIHTSDRIMFRRCQRKAFLASKLWMGLQAIRPNATLWLGTGVHKAIEMYYGYGHDLAQTFEKWADERLAQIKKETGLLNAELPLFEDSINTGKGILQHYNLFAQRYDDFHVYKIDGKPAVEVMFEVPIIDPYTGEQLYFENGDKRIPIFYGGRFDMIVEDDFGDLWIMDHKTAKTFADWSKLSIDTQVGSYIWAAEQVLPLDKHIHGVIYNGIKKTVPHKPEILKSGKLSKNKSQSTTYELYLEAINEQGFDPAEYNDVLEYLKGLDSVSENVIENKYFRREKVRRSRDEVQSIEFDIYHEATQMVATNYFYPNPTRDCSWDCDFLDVCRGLYNNEDVNYMLESMYGPRPSEEDEFSVYALGGGE